ncbi:hypothetical protein A3K79_00705 [Candidatus Bathyarchaeota archaeon RBG_13_46_16b]|nr:MAG: hypothetical protein A3K79_00705 [Candidatus Bathyarchaeota archaeon RBG_13_46_16b]
MQETFKVLFDEKRKPIDVARIKCLVTDFSESYDKVVKQIINDSATLNRETFGFNVATLLPSFGMTRRGVFHGLKIEKGIIKDPKRVLDACWIQAGEELLDLKNRLSQHTSHRRSRAILELSPEPRNGIVAKLSELFDKLEWTTINGSDIGRVGASKILFAVLPEIALPVDNAEWDYVFRTYSYGKVLSIMIDEISEWEKQSNTHLETVDLHSPTTLTSVYNVMAMAARPSKV